MFLYLHFLQRTFYTLICDPTSSRRASASSLAASWLRGRSLVLTAGLSGRRSEQKHQIAKPLRHLDREGGGVSFNTLVDENQEREPQLLITSLGVLLPSRLETD